MKKVSEKICLDIEKTLAKHKAKDVIRIDLANKSSMADFMIICSGTSNRHVVALSNYISERLKKKHSKNFNIEGRKNGDWILVDIGDVIIHLFRGEVRSYYNLERMWQVDINSI